MYHPHLNPPPSRGRRFVDCPPLQKGRRFNVIANDRRECGNPKHANLDSLLPSPNDIKGNGNDNSQIPSPPEGEGQGEGDKILSTEEARRRFKLLKEKLMAMKSP